jgi:hypothetical protein
MKSPPEISGIMAEAAANAKDARAAKGVRKNRRSIT